MRPASVSLLFAMLLSGCSPGLVLNLYNSTGDTLTVTNPPLRRVVTIPPNTAADVDIAGDVRIQSSRHSWSYSSASLRPPISILQKHTMLWRAFGKIDSRGDIFLFAPPSDHGTPQQTAQPAGFPVKPQKT